MRNGGAPFNKTNSKTPRLNISAFSPSYGRSKIISGAAYDLVPYLPVNFFVFPF